MLKHELDSELLACAQSVRVYRVTSSGTLIPPDGYQMSIARFARRIPSITRQFTATARIMSDDQKPITAFKVGHELSISNLSHMISSTNIVHHCHFQELVDIPEQKQNLPGLEGNMDPIAEHTRLEKWDDEGKPYLQEYKGSGKLQGKAAIITGGDSGIGRAVALAFVREGAAVTITYLKQEKEE